MAGLVALLLQELVDRVPVQSTQILADLGGREQALLVVGDEVGVLHQTSPRPPHHDGPRLPSRRGWHLVPDVHEVPTRFALVTAASASTVQLQPKG